MLLLGKQHTKCGREISPGPFSKKNKFRISQEQQSEILCSLFLLNTLVEAYLNILKVRC